MNVERTPSLAIGELSERSRDIFRQIVETYLETGQPVGSRTLSKRLPINLSPASIRNVMSDLEAAGLLAARHTSAGRLPTDRGLRMFVDGLLELGQMTEAERASIELRCKQSNRSLQAVLEEVSTTLSGLSRCAGLVIVPKSESPLKHIEFVSLGAGRALVVLVNEGGLVENRVIEVPPGVPASAMQEATNYLNARLRGRTIQEAAAEVKLELEDKRVQLDELTAKVVSAGLATWAGGSEKATLIVSGRSNLLEDLSAASDLERIRRLFDDLESALVFGDLLALAQQADGVRIFIGSENKLFSLSGSAMIVAPYSDGKHHVVGAIGVIGPTHINYARIVPIVDYTARMIGRLIG